MRVEVLPDVTALARRAAEVIAEAARAAVAAPGRFLLAVSGGETPWRMLRVLAELQVPWSRVELFQVDERVAPARDPERNLTHLRESLLGRAPIPGAQVHPMPVEEADLAAAAARYAAVLEEVAGRPPVLDLVHLGLGADGHTASLMPGDPALEVTGADVAITGPFRGRRRMTLTLPALARARRILWVVTGADKAAALASLRQGHTTLPAGRVPGDRAILLADAAAGSPSHRPGKR